MLLAAPIPSCGRSRKASGCPKVSSGTADPFLLVVFATNGPYLMPLGVRRGGEQRILHGEWSVGAVLTWELQVGGPTSFDRSVGKAKVRPTVARPVRDRIPRR